MLRLADQADCVKGINRTLAAGQRVTLSRRHIIKDCHGYKPS
jgi:hypothetical protein